MRLTAASRRGGLTPALPMPYQALTNAGLRLRRGQLSLTIAAPGVGKTQLWANIAHRAAVPTAYWSADTDRHDVVIRTLAMWSGKATGDVEREHAQPAWAEWYDRLLVKSNHIDWIFDSAITAKIVGERLNAFAERHGQYPHLFVVDNLSNTVQRPDMELAEQKEVLVGLQRLARQTEAHIAVLAHAKGEYENGDKPIPQAGALNNMFKYPEVGLTLHRANENSSLLGLNIVKNRGGKADPAARHPIHFEVDYSTATVKGFRS